MPKMDLKACLLFTKLYPHSGVSQRRVLDTIWLKYLLFSPTGILTLKRANELLSTCVPGSFLIRVSERIRGYALSYLSEDGCKHFLIDASTDSYSFLGVDQLQHATLAELVEYHKVRRRSVGFRSLVNHCSAAAQTMKGNYQKND